MSTLGTKTNPVRGRTPISLAKGLLETLAGPTGQGLWYREGKWLYWWNQDWKTLSDNEVEEIIWSTCGEWWISSETDESKKNLVSLTGNLVRDMVSALKAVAKFPYKEWPMWVGAPEGVPPAKECVAFRDKVRHLHSDWECDRDESWIGPIVPHRLGGGIPERWLGCLQQWSSHMADGDQWIELMQRVFGMLITSHRDYQRMVLLVGKTRGGKGVTTRLMEKLVGGEVTKGGDLETIACTEYGAAGLERARLMVVGEIHDLRGASGRTAASLLKNIIGRDRVMVNTGKWRPTVECVSDALVVLCGNQLPSFPDTAGALNRKMVILPYEVSFVGKEDLGLDEVLASEIEDVAAWAWEGARKLAAANAAGRWPVVGDAEKARLAYVERANPEQSFLEWGFRANPQGAVPVAAVVNGWRNWARESELPKAEQNRGPRNIVKSIIEKSEWSLQRIKGSGGVRMIKGMTPTSRVDVDSWAG